VSSAGGELEVEHVEVLGDPFGPYRLRDRGAAFLQVPADHHLRRGLAVGGGDRSDGRVVEGAGPGTAVAGDAADRRPGLGEDAVAGVRGLHGRLGEVRVHLDLVDRGHHRSVKIIGDSHGPVRIGSRVQILENTVLHLLPDNELVIDDDAVIGPGAMIHGCHIGRGSIVEPGAIVCDGSVTGAESVVRAGACVKQRDRFGDRSILDGFPARLVGALTGPPPMPGWALPPDAVATLRKVQR
jgi:carbonic anhydrase/acetyltransferase-like protein (isoleucine patch superfamily)